MSSWHTYPQSFALGHKYLTDLLLDPVMVEEKVDGSQFSFGVFGETGPGWVAGDPIIKARSKGAEIYVSAEGHSSQKMFQKAVDTVVKLAPRLRQGFTYRAEYLPKPKAVTLAYDRVPKDFLIIFDICYAEESYLPPAERADEAERLGLEVVPVLYKGMVTDVGLIHRLLDTVSVLGGQKIEGVVVKNYNRFGLDKKILIGKYVSEKFKEIHGKDWKTENPKSGDIVQTIGQSLRTPARWQKAVQHLREAGKLEGSPRDIGSLFREVPNDIEKECRTEILDALWAWAWPSLKRIATAGLPEWYKNELLSQQAVATTEEKS